MSDFHNLQEENRRLTAEVERLKAELATANMPKLTPMPAAPAEPRAIDISDHAHTLRSDAPRYTPPNAAVTDD